jgi:HEAT repeat protein
VAVYGLARTGDERHMVVLARGLEGSKKDVRRNAAYLLGLLGNRSAAPMLRSHMNDRDPMTRLRAAEALVRLGDSRGLNVIRSMTLAEGGTRTDPALQLGAVLVLGQVGIASEDIDRLRWIELQRANDGAVRVAAFGARGMLGDYSQMTTLAEIAAGRSGFGPGSQAMALQMLARSAYGPAWRDACSALDAGDPTVRLSAAWAMLAFNNPRAAEVIEAMSSTPRPYMLTEDEVLRPVRNRLEPAAPGGPLGPLNGRAN